MKTFLVCLVTAIVLTFCGSWLFAAGVNHERQVIAQALVLSHAHICSDGTSL